MPLPTPQSVKITHNLKNKNKITPCSERLRSRWAAAARSQAVACAPGGTLGLQMGECQGNSSPQQPLPWPRLQGAGRQSAGKLNLNRNASSCRGRGERALRTGKQGWPASSARGRGLSANYLELSGCGPGHASTPDITSPTSGPQRVSGPRSRVPVSSTLNPRGLSGSPAEGGAVRCAWCVRPEADPREDRIPPDGRAV